MLNPQGPIQAEFQAGFDGMYLATFRRPKVRGNSSLTQTRTLSCTGSSSAAGKSRGRHPIVGASLHAVKPNMGVSNEV